MADFSGRSALITGAASGIGAAVARWLDAQGIAELILVDRDEAGLTTLDHALINAGVANGGLIADTDFTEWRRILSVNLDGAFLSLRTALRVMKRGGGKSVVLTSSAAGVKPVASSGAYGASKAGVSHLARVAAAEHLKDGIRVNAVAPGRVDTPIWTRTDYFRQLEESLGSRQAALEEIGRQATGDAHGFITADEIAAQIGFLLSDAAVNITGTVLVADGGYTL